MQETHVKALNTSNPYLMLVEEYDGSEVERNPGQYPYVHLEAVPFHLPELPSLSLRQY